MILEQIRNIGGNLGEGFFIRGDSNTGVKLLIRDIGVGVYDYLEGHYGLNIVINTTGREIYIYRWNTMYWRRRGGARNGLVIDSDNISYEIWKNGMMMRQG